MKPKYIRNEPGQILAHLTEECGEVLAAAGKSMRWGLDSYNPELPPEQREFNIDWLRREIVDLEAVIARVKLHIFEAQPLDQLPSFDYCCHGLERKYCDQCPDAS